MAEPLPIPGLPSREGTARSGSADGTLDEAIGSAPLEFRQLVLREWRERSDVRGWRSSIRELLNDGLGVHIHFFTEVDARNFMSKVHDRMIESVRRETKTNWRP